MIVVVLVADVVGLSGGHHGYDHRADNHCCSAFLHCCLHYYYCCYGVALVAVSGGDAVAVEGEGDGVHQELWTVAAHVLSEKRFCTAWVRGGCPPVTNIV